ncbi:MAG: 4Fe-4S dicluster domain-containing protein [Chloroflexi bacterium]|nr:4Fe-4S dicluster domain-containing protein [Chloroflexota bacterium]
MKRIYSKEDVCMACHLCEVYCQAGHAKSKDMIKAFKKELPAALPRTRVEEKKPVSLSVQCRHCDEPACVYACLTGAMTKDPVTGIVNVDTEKCVGCWTCILVCPYGAIRQDKDRGRIAKCDLCVGRDMPLCVVNCPNEALVYAEVATRS